MKARTQRIAATLGVALLALGCDIDIDITDTGADSAEDGINDDGMEEEGGSEEGTEEGGSEVTDGGEEGPADTGGEEEEGGSEVSDGGEESEGGEDSGGLGLECDPLVQDCADGDACYGIGDEFLCAPDASGDQGATLDPCEFVNVCDTGLNCVSAEWLPSCVGSAGCCTPFCDLADPTCPDGECVPYFEEGVAPPAYENVGLCVNY